MSEGAGSGAASSHLPVARSDEFDPRPGPARSGGSPVQGAAIAGGRHWHAVTVTRSAFRRPLVFTRRCPRGGSQCSRCPIKGSSCLAARWRAAVANGCLVWHMT